MTAEEQVEIEHIASLGFGASGECLDFLVDRCLAEIVKYGRRTKRVGRCHAARDGLEDRPRIDVATAELDLRPERLFASSERERHLPSLRRLGLLGLRECFEGQAATAQQYGKGWRSQMF